MCPNCFSSGIANFPSYWEFEAFEAALQQKLVREQLLPLPSALPRVLTANLLEQQYQCPACNEIWVISTPDNAWRGYFLPLRDAVARGQQLQRSDRNRQVGCLTLLLTVAVFAIWQLFS